MNTVEEGSGAESMAVATVDDAADHDVKGLDEETTAADDSNGLSADSTSTANVEQRAGEGEQEGERNDESQIPDGGELLLGWKPSHDGVTPTRSLPIDYNNVDDAPYEHNFERGDHIIRWEMLPILWPIQIHAIVLDVSEDKSEVTICDFGITSVKNDEEEKKYDVQIEKNEINVEEENCKFIEAIQDECDDEESVSTDASTTKKKPLKKKQRLTVLKLTKWSDLRKWKKVNYEGGLLNVGRGGVGKGLKNLGKKTGNLWTSMTKSFARNKDDAVEPQDTKKAWRSVRYDVDEKGYCVHHPHIQLQRLKDNGEWVFVRKKCPECIREDCPIMMGAESTNSRSPSLESAPSFSSTEDEQSPSQKKMATSVKTLRGDREKAEKSEQTSVDGNAESLSESGLERKDSKVVTKISGADSIDAVPTEMDEPKTLAQMISEANEIDMRSRKGVVYASSPERASSLEKKSMATHQKWQGSFMNSFSNIFPSKNWTETSTSVDSTSEEKKIESSLGENGEETANSEKQQSPLDNLPRSDPPILVLARTRFILEHGESVLPPYHIVNSNSECIAVWCKTGRWSTLQASVFLHSTAIGNAKSATALTLGVAATNPWLIPAFATVGLAAVGTPWLMLKMANDKWTVATTSLTEKFWAQAEPEVFVECIEKWSNIR